MLLRFLLNTRLVGCAFFLVVIALLWFAQLDSCAAYAEAALGFSPMMVGGWVGGRDVPYVYMCANHCITLMGKRGLAALGWERVSGWGAGVTGGRAGLRKQLISANTH